MGKIDISVIIVVQNRAEVLPTSLSHLEHQSFPSARYEVIAVDDGSTDESYDVLKRQAEGAPMRVQLLHQNQSGLNQARNLALESASGKWLLFLDQDILAGPHLLERHLEAHERLGGDTGVVGAIHRHPHLSKGVLSTRLLPMQMHEAPPENTPLSFLEWNFANMSLPRNHFMAFGGFDTSTRFFGCGGAEIAWRLMGHGVQAFAEPTATAYDWREAPISSRRIDAYQQGFALYELEQELRSGEIQLRYRLDRSVARHLLDAFMIPLLARLGRNRPRYLPSLQRLTPRILSYDLYCGYRDARLGRHRHQLGPVAESH